MHEPLALHTLAHAHLLEQVNRALLESPGPDAMLHVAAAAGLERDRLDAPQVQQVAEHQPGRPSPDDPHLSAIRPFRTHTRSLALPRYRLVLMRLLAPIFVLGMWLLVAAPAFAGDNGEGLVGETDDRIITFFSLGMVVFFTVLVVLLSALQGRLDKRKQERKATELRKRVGW